MAELYRSTFTTVLANAEKVTFSELGWGDNELKAMCEVMPSLEGAKELWLEYHNDFTDIGAGYVASAIAAGSMQKLKLLGMDCNGNRQKNPKQSTRENGKGKVGEECARRNIYFMCDNW